MHFFFLLAFQLNMKSGYKVGVGPKFICATCVEEPHFDLSIHLKNH